MQVDQDHSFRKVDGRTANCHKCGVLFYPCPSMFRYGSFTCRPCANAKSREQRARKPDQYKLAAKLAIRRWRSLNPDRNKEIAAKYFSNPENLERVRAHKREYAKANKDKLRARMAFYKAVVSGVIQRGDCSICGAPNADGHHEDYSKPLEVVWLCKTHHKRLHVGWSE